MQRNMRVCGWHGLAASSWAEGAIVSNENMDFVVAAAIHVGAPRLAFESTILDIDIRRQKGRKLMNTNLKVFARANESVGMPGQAQVEQQATTIGGAANTL